MKSLRLIAIFLTGMAVTSFLISIGTSRWLVFFIVISLYLVTMVLPGIYAVYFSNSLRQIERYIKRNRFKAIFAFPYALGHGSDQDIENAIERILAVHKQATMQSVYRTLLAIYRGQSSIAQQHAEGIDREPMRSYYLAHAAVASGDLERAADISKGIPEPWMKHSIEALIAFEKNDARFYSLVEKSVGAARGVQKYTLEKSFERMKKPIA
ncbi:hypothetical protein DHX103_04420 [Planococcus sp. X10-3]|uniref:hypothetical protein n=1 Tax=Planococcus sp. X10-3 TaxID=3061240 RepID=UPI003BAFDAA2